MGEKAAARLVLEAAPSTHAAGVRSIGQAVAVVAKKDQLEKLELDPWRVMAIAAHPDDVEYGASAAVAKWAGSGAEIIYLIASRGEAGMDDTEPADAGMIRSGEQHAAAKIVGVDVIDFLDIDDGVIENTIPVRRAIARDIRRFRPDVILLFNHRETWSPGVLNSADHRNLGQAALDAIGDAGNRWVFRDMGDPHKVDTALIVNSPQATHGIDVTGFENKAVQSLAQHEKYLASLGTHPLADPVVVRTMLHDTAKRLTGAKAAIAVEVFNFT